MTDADDGPDPRPDDAAAPEAARDPPDDAPTISCRRCDREWDLDDELQRVGNQAFEQFALDHRRHTGHFPDGVETWRAVCRHCPEAVERLGAAQARRWARTHARHTRHDVDIESGDGEESGVVEAPGDG